MTTPENLKYTRSHEWVRLEPDGTATVGITFHAQEQLGDIVFVQNPQPGNRVKQGEACGAVESVKAAADLYAPLSGEVVAANPEVAQHPEQVNRDPYAAWMFRIRPSDPSELGGLLDAAAYRALAASQKP
jgi:glycine cleavage system H protein